MAMERFEVFPLHRNKHLIKQCCAVINSEWPRSEMARYFFKLVIIYQVPSTSFINFKLEHNDTLSLMKFKLPTYLFNILKNQKKKLSSQYFIKCIIFG